MPLKKIQFRPGVNRENTRYTNEMGWYESQLVRFRQGTPEVVGGWEKTSVNKFLGVCRALWSWITLSGSNLVAVGTNLKYYIERGGNYYDITPIADVTTGTAVFTATPGSSILTVSDPSYTSYITNDFVTYANAVSLGENITAAVLNQEYQILSVDNGANTYTIDVGVAAGVGDIGDGGAATVATYQINTGPEIQVPRVGWGAGLWGLGPWGIGTTSDNELRIWSQSNYGQALIFGPRYGGLYYWDPTGGVTNNPGVNIASLPGASDVPTQQQVIVISDVSRFVFAMGCNDIGSSELDPMLIRWSDQEDYLNWTPAPTNQAGSIRLSHGSEIATAIQTRQEIVVLTDMAVYSLQYVGAPVVWQSTLLADGTSCFSPNSAVFAANTLYWMGNDKFYKYDGTVQTLNCDLRKYIFQDINREQPYQVFGGAVEAFNEVWWFYCSEGSTEIDRYVVYNYMEKIWYYGNLGRTAWLDTDTRDYPIAATYFNNLVYHEKGVNDYAGDDPAPINAWINSAEWDADDGHNFSFMYRMLPDLTFSGSSNAPDGSTPQATLSVIPLKNSGSGYTTPASVGGSDSANVNRIATVPVEEFTGQVFIRVRGRQFVFRIESNQLNTTWQLGSPRVDIRNDGRR